MLSVGECPVDRRLRETRQDALERYKTRKTVERGLGYLKYGRRMASRYDRAHRRCLGFPHLAGTGSD